MHFRYDNRKEMKLTKHGEIVLKHCKKVMEEDQKLIEDLSSHENYIPQFEPYKIMTKMIDDPDNIMEKRLNELVCSPMHTIRI